MTCIGCTFHPCSPHGSEGLTIIEAGTYAVTIPAVSCMLGRGTDVHNEEFTITYTVNGASGITGISVDGRNAPEIHTIGGQKVNVPTKGGIYVIDGKKVLMK